MALRVDLLMDDKTRKEIKDWGCSDWLPKRLSCACGLSV